MTQRNKHEYKPSITYVGNDMIEISGPAFDVIIPRRLLVISRDCLAKKHGVLCILVGEEHTSYSLDFDTESEAEDFYEQCRFAMTMTDKELALFVAEEGHA